jgi:hypothetical protein
VLAGALVGLAGALTAVAWPVGAAGAGPASHEVPLQEESTTTTRPELLVPGPTVGSTTTSVSTTTTTVAASGLFEGLRQDFRDMVADETGRTVAIAIGGLVLVALILAVLTIRYWRKTRPVRPAKPTEATDG